MPMTKSTVPENATPTPGPWTLEESTPGDGHHFIRGADGSYVVYPDDGWNSDYRDYATRLANARLIAAAPEMLAALKALVGEVELKNNLSDEGAWSGCDQMERARAAIANAEGAK
jgi:hypothetical protein